MRFTKMHGAGNDFVCLDAIREPELAARGDLDAVARVVCDRRTGIGGDGLILISPPADGAGVRMRMFNADGSESAMCGNGIRCVARYAVEHGLAEPDADGVLAVETGAGLTRCRLAGDAVDAVTVDMGRPVLELADIPVDRAGLDGGEGPVYTLTAGGTRYEAVFVSMGNPHAVIYAGDVAGVDLARVGPLLEHHAAFPQRMNAHFVQVASPGEVTVRTWERGSGITGACGSGACAVCVAGVLTGRTERRLLAHLPGGDLEIEWRETDARVSMTGPAVEVFGGEIAISH